MMTKDFKQELSNFLDFLEDKTDDVYKTEVEFAIKDFKEKHSL